MNHYQKLATIIFRIIGIVAFIAGLLLFLSSLSFSSASYTPISSLSILVIFTPHLLGGLLLFVSSKFLAKLVCFDLNEK